MNQAVAQLQSQSWPASPLPALSISPGEQESPGSIHNATNSQKNPLCELSDCYLVLQWTCGSFLLCLLVGEQVSNIKKEEKVAPGPIALVGVSTSFGYICSGPQTWQGPTIWVGRAWRHPSVTPSLPDPHVTHSPQPLLLLPLLVLILLA